MNYLQGMIDELQLRIIRLVEENESLKKQLASENKLGEPVWPSEPGPKQIIEMTGK